MVHRCRLAVGLGALSAVAVVWIAPPRRSMDPDASAFLRQLEHGPWTAQQHLAWCREHAPRLNVTDVQAVFRYVQRHHPIVGVAFPLGQAPDLTGAERTGELALLADAVTVMAYEQVGHDFARRM